MSANADNTTKPMPEKYVITIESTGDSKEAEKIAMTAQQMLLNAGHVVQSTTVTIPDAEAPATPPV